MALLVYYATTLILVIGFIDTLNAKNDENVKRVAIVGAGVAGSSAAYYFNKLRKEIGINVIVDVYESTDRVGGRVMTIKSPLDGPNVGGYEAGGSIIHSKNKHAVELLSELNLKKKTKSKDSTLTGIFDGQQFVFEESSNSLITAIKMIWRYGMSLFKMKSMINHMLASFELIYFYQDNERRTSFDTLEQVLNSMSTNFVAMTRMPLKDYLIKTVKIDDKLINEVINSITLVNYGQSVDELHSFVGSVAMAGAGDNLWNVDGGNELLPIKMVNNSDANIFIGNSINIIDETRDAKDGKNRFKVTDVNNNQIIYDAIVISHPLTSSAIEFRGFDQLTMERIKNEKHRQKYHLTVATFVVGERSKFLTGSTNSVDDVIVCDPNYFIQSIARLNPVNSDVQDVNSSKNGDNNHMFKIFSKKTLTKEELNQLFDSISWTQSVDWYAYPNYDLKAFQTGHEDQWPRFKLMNGLFYTNAIELSASAIEMSLISGKNAAFLVKEYLQKGDN